MPTSVRPGTLSVRDRPAYPLAEAARYVKVAPATLRSWILGRNYATQQGGRHWAPLIKPADRTRVLLSFNNLVEAHVLRSLRGAHAARVPQIRAAINYAARELDIDRVLLSRELSTSAGDLFLTHLGELINLSRSGQLAMRKVLEGHLRRVERDLAGMPLRLLPFLSADDGGTAGLIAIDPAIGFGRPILQSRGIATSTIVARIDAGETVASVASDYGVTVDEVTEAVVYERAA